MNKNILKKPVIKRFIFISLVFALIASMFSGCYLLPPEEERLEAPTLKVKEISYTTYTVERADIEREESGTGYFQSTVNESLMFGKSGTIKKIHVRSGETVTQGQLLAELETGDIAERIEYQEYVVEKAKLNYYAQSQNDYGYSAQISKLDYDYQKKQLDKLYEQIENSAIYSPIDGIITYAAGLTSGDNVASDRVIVTISDPEQLIIVYKPTAVDEIFTGMELDITMKNDNKSYVGLVTQTPADVPPTAADSEQNFIYIELNEIPEFATIGTSANISILLSRKENVIVLPSKYISKVSTRYYVRVLIDGLPEERDITVGINNGSHYEITGGIEEGELLVS